MTWPNTYCYHHWCCKTTYVTLQFHNKLFFEFCDCKMDTWFYNKAHQYWYKLGFFSLKGNKCISLHLLKIRKESLSLNFPDMPLTSQHVASIMKRKSNQKAPNQTHQSALMVSAFPGCFWAKIFTYIFHPNGILATFLSVLLFQKYHFKTPNKTNTLLDYQKYLILLSYTCNFKAF